MTEMLEDFALPNGKLAHVALRRSPAGDRYFVVLGPRANATVLGPLDDHLEALRRVCRLFNVGRTS